MKPADWRILKIHFRLNPRWPIAGQREKIASIFKPNSHYCTRLKWSSMCESKTVALSGDECLMLSPNLVCSSVHDSLS